MPSRTRRGSKFDRSSGASPGPDGPLHRRGACSTASCGSSRPAPRGEISLRASAPGRRSTGASGPGARAGSSTEHSAAFSSRRRPRGRAARGRGASTRRSSGPAVLRLARDRASTRRNRRTMHSAVLGAASGPRCARVRRPRNAARRPARSGSGARPAAAPPDGPSRPLAPSKASASHGRQGLQRGLGQELAATTPDRAGHSHPE